MEGLISSIGTLRSITYIQFKLNWNLQKHCKRDACLKALLVTICIPWRCTISHEPNLVKVNLYFWLSIIISLNKLSLTQKKVELVGLEIQRVLYSLNSEVKAPARCHVSDRWTKDIRHRHHPQRALPRSSQISDFKKKDDARGRSLDPLLQPPGFSALCPPSPLPFFPKLASVCHRRRTTGRTEEVTAPQAMRGSTWGTGSSGCNRFQPRATWFHAPVHRAPPP